MNGSSHPVTDLSQFDDPGFLDKALGPQGAQELLEKNRRLITGNRAYIARIRRDLGFGSRPPTPHVGVISTITVVASRREEFEQGLKGPVVTAMKDANVDQFFVWQIIYGGDANQYLTSMFDNYEVRTATPTRSRWAMRGDEISRIFVDPTRRLRRSSARLLHGGIELPPLPVPGEVTAAVTIVRVQGQGSAFSVQQVRTQNLEPNPGPIAHGR